MNIIHPIKFSQYISYAVKLGDHILYDGDKSNISLGHKIQTSINMTYRPLF